MIFKQKVYDAITKKDDNSWPTSFDILRSKKALYLIYLGTKQILFFSAISQFFIMTLTFMAISFASLTGYGYLSTVAKAWFLDEAKLRMFFRISGTIFVMMGIGMALWH